jgi:hypothetical protein
MTTPELIAQLKASTASDQVKWLTDALARWRT